MGGRFRIQTRRGAKMIVKTESALKVDLKGEERTKWSTAMNIMESSKKKITTMMRTRRIRKRTKR